MLFKLRTMLTANSRVLQDNIADTDAGVIAHPRLAVILGIVDTYEFVPGGCPTHDALFPLACNWTSPYQTGGSSSGCGPPQVARPGSGVAGSTPAVRSAAQRHCVRCRELQPPLAGCLLSGVVPLTFSSIPSWLHWRGDSGRLRTDAASDGVDMTPPTSWQICWCRSARERTDQPAGRIDGRYRAWLLPETTTTTWLDIAGTYDVMWKVFEGLGAKVIDTELPPLMDFMPWATTLSEAMSSTRKTPQTRWTEFARWRAIE